MLIDKAHSYHVNYHKKLPSQEGWKLAWCQKELEQTGALLGKPVYIYCISLPGLSVSWLHSCSLYTHTQGQFILVGPTTRLPKGGFDG